MSPALWFTVLGCTPRCGDGTHVEDGVCVADEDKDPDPTDVGNEVDLDDYPPVVVATSPVSGDLTVDPSTDTMSVTFSRPMMDQAWSWVTIGQAEFPDLDSVSYTSADTNTAVGVVMTPDTTYQVWFNSPFGTYTSFVDPDGVSALPYPLIFHTGDGTDPSVLAGFEPAVVASVPTAGADDVDAALDRIEVMFNKDMDRSTMGWRDDDSDETYPTVGEEGFADARTAYLEVTLEPSSTYAVWVNTGAAAEFRDVDGNQALPWLLTFRTADP